MQLEAVIEIKRQEREDSQPKVDLQPEDEPASASASGSNNPERAMVSGDDEPGPSGVNSEEGSNRIFDLLLYIVCCRQMMDQRKDASHATKCWIWPASLESHINSCKVLSDSSDDFEPVCSRRPPPVTATRQLPGPSDRSEAGPSRLQVP